MKVRHIAAIVLMASFPAIAINSPTLAASPPPSADLPNPALTPGDASPVTPTVICKASYHNSAGTRLTKHTEAGVFRAYSIPKKAEDRYAIDLLIPASLGGLASSQNLWPIPLNLVSKKKTVEKDVLESVCGGFITVATAQSALVSHWDSIPTSAAQPNPSVTVQYFFAAAGTNFLRFAAAVTNPGLLPLEGVALQWTAYNAAGVVVGSYNHRAYPIGALSTIEYDGGAGRTILTGPPARVAVTITGKGSYTHTLPPVDTVGTIQLASSSSNLFSNATTYTVSGVVTIGGNKPVTTSDLDISLTLLNATGSIVGVTFDDPTNLPTTLMPGTKVEIKTNVPVTGTPASAKVTVGVQPNS